METSTPGTSNDATSAQNQLLVAATAERMQALQVQDPPPAPAAIPWGSEFLKDGKLSFIEPKLRTENHFVITQRIIQFRAFRIHLESNAAVFSQPGGFQFPREFRDLVAVLAQDSDEPISQLSVRINDILSPFQRNERYSNIFTDAIEKTIREVATRVKYGVSPEVLTAHENGPSTMPMHLCIFRWEALDISFLPLDLQQVIKYRRALREQMSAAVTYVFKSYPVEQQLAILQTRHYRKNNIVDDLKSPAEIELERERQRKKEEEKRKKEEEKRLREEDRRKREEERKKREEEKKRKGQTQLRLTSLFTKAVDDKANNSTQSGTLMEKPNMFPPFYIKEHMSVHPWIVERKAPSPDFEQQLKSYTTDPYKMTPVSEELKRRFLQELHASGQPEVTQKRGISRTVDFSRILLGPPDNNLELFSRLAVSMKLLQFTEDVRPAYYGTWTKRSNRINGRRPFVKDDELVDYEHDSEAEWEPEEEGEDIQSGDEEEEDPYNDTIDPEDAGWLVPEGYLSEGEGVDSDEDESRRVISRPAVRPAKERVAIRPVVIGPVFETSDDEKDEVLRVHQTTMLFDVVGEYDPFRCDSHNSTPSETTEAKPPVVFTDQHANELMSIIEGKADGMPKLVSEAKENWLLRDMSKRQIEAKIKDLAVKVKLGSDTKPAWHAKSSNNNNNNPL